jgi:hypothetical protein
MASNEDDDHRSGKCDEEGEDAASGLLFAKDAHDEGEKKGE